MQPIAFFYDDQVLKHRPPPGHPEQPGRLRALVDHLKETGLWERLNHPPFDETPDELILSVHTRSHFELVKNTCASGGGIIDDGDTHVVPESFDAAKRAAGAVIAAIDAVAGRKAAAAFCAIRPPGHHAESNRPMGFCLFNNAAIGARYAQRRHGAQKLAILDWDVHHGNGTQQIFYEDPTVLYISLHQFPFYPGTGSRNERGEGKGDGYTLNIPLPAGTGEDRYLEAFREEIIPALERYDPELLLISAGFDAHRNDPLGGMDLTEESFATMTRMVKSIAPIVSILEGGYNLSALARSTEAHLRVLGEEETPTVYS